jgi:hypothetical protein
LSAAGAVGASVVAFLGLVPSSSGIHAGSPAAVGARGGASLSAGERVDGLELTTFLPPTGSRDHVSFVYGDCVAGDDAGCSAPAEVQVWPACTRPLALYDGTIPGLVLERTIVRGVPAVTLDGGRRLEFQTGDRTVVVFADSPGRVARIAAALRSDDGAVAPRAPLPGPSSGGREGVVDC